MRHLLTAMLWLWSTALALVQPANSQRLEQYPFFDVDGWMCHGRGCESLRTLQGALVGQDKDESEW